MDVNNVEKKENGKLTFQVEIDSAAFEAAVNKAYLKAKKDISIPGFRKGKAPRALIENMYGKAVFYDDAIADLADDAYTEGAKATDVRTVGRPSITNYNVADDKTLTIDFAVAMFPTAELGQYKGIEVYSEPVEVSDEELAKELEKVQKRNSRVLVVERPAKDGDTVNIDYDGYKDGKRFEGGKGEKHDLVLGSNSFVPGFEEQLVGMSAGEEKDINITFPDNYYKELAGAAVVFKVKINEVKEIQLPELDDEFAKDVSEFDTLDEYKADLKVKLESAKKTAAENEVREESLQKAAENMTVTIPDEMIDENVDNLVDDYRRNCAMQGMDFKQYLGMMGMDENAFRGIMRITAESQAKNQVLLEAVAEAESIAVTEEDLEAEYKKAAETYGMEVEQIKASIPSEIVSRDIKMRKAADCIADSVVVTDKKPEKPEEKAE